MSMSNKMKRFCDEYLIDLNGKEAAVRAGYAPNYADRQAYRLMQNAEVKAYIAERMAEKDKELIASQDEVIKYLTTVLRGKELDEKIVFNNFGEAKKTAIRNQQNQLKAAEMLAKRYGLLDNKVSITGAIPVVISGEENLED